MKNIFVNVLCSILGGWIGQISYRPASKIMTEKVFPFVKKVVSDLSDFWSDLN